MDVTNNEMDDGMRREEAERVFAVKNANNNDSNYVGSRYNDLHSHADNAVPIRQDAGIDGHLFPVPQKRGRSSPDGKGIVAALRDENGQLGKYLIEINGSNGVEVTKKL